MIRLQMPAHLRDLAKVKGEVLLEVDAPVTPRRLLDALEAKYPMLQGTIRDHVSKERRVYVRYFACMEDVSFAPMDAPVPEDVALGKEPFIVMGAVSGGVR